MTTIARKFDIDSASRDAMARRIEELEYVIDTLLPPEGREMQLAATFGLTPQQSLLVACLANGRPWSFEALLGAVTHWSQHVEIGLIKVLASEARKKLPAGCAIINIYGFGYRMNAEGAAHIRGIMEGRP